MPSNLTLGATIRTLFFIVALTLSTAALAGEMRFAVAEFTNASAAEGHAPLGKGLQSMFTTDLSKVPGVKIVERERLHELMSELKLGDSAAVDDATAAKLGQLSGASHYLAGSFTLVGDTMRLDARLFAVQAGEVLLAESVQGDSKLFFDLQKQLLARLVKTLQVELSPKERVAIQRVHTADFAAFEAYSWGIAHYDDAEYDQALDALKRATVLDEDFKLASLTLADYEQLIDKMSARTDALRDVQQREDRLRREARYTTAQQAQSAVLSSLISIAEAAAPGDRSRLTALYLLAWVYTYRGPATPIGALLRNSDSFAMARLGERLFAQYTREAKVHFPLVPAVLDHSLFALAYPSADTLQGDLAAAEAALWGDADPSAHTASNLGDLHLISRSAVALHLDRAHQVAWLRSLLGDDPPRERSHQLAKELRAIGDLDGSTSVWAELSADPRATASDVARYTREVVLNKRLLEAVVNAKNPDVAVEFQRLALSSSRSAKWTAASSAQAGRGDPKALAQLDELRGWRSTQMHRWGERPSWLLQGHRAVRSGPRPDVRQIQRVRYDGSKANGVPALWIVTPDERGDLRAEIEVESSGASVAWLVGVRDVLVPSLVRDNKRAVDHPMRGWLVEVRDGELVIASYQESQRKSNDRVAFEETVLAKSALDGKDGERGPFVVTVKGKKINAKLGSARVQATLEQAPEGYVGLRVRGGGRATLLAPKID